MSLRSARPSLKNPDRRYIKNKYQKQAARKAKININNKLHEWRPGDGAT